MIFCQKRNKVKINGRLIKLLTSKGWLGMGWKGEKVLGQSSNGGNGCSVGGIILPSILLCIVTTFRLWEPY